MGDKLKEVRVTTEYSHIGLPTPVVAVPSLLLMLRFVYNISVLTTNCCYTACACSTVNIFTAVDETLSVILCIIHYSSISVDVGTAVTY